MAQSMLDRPPHDGNLDEGSEGGPNISWAISSGIPPCPISMDLEGGSEEGPTTPNPTHTYHLNLPTCGPDNCCHLQIQGCLPCLPKMLNFTNTRG